MSAHDPTGPCPACKAITNVVLCFFDCDEQKAAQWLATSNPNFGCSPVALMRLGRCEMVLDFVRDAMEANAAAERARIECELQCAWKGGGPCLRDDCPRREPSRELGLTK